MKGVGIISAIYVLCSVVFCSCSNKVKFYPSSTLPAAEGNVKIKRDQNNNYAVKVNVQNLGNPANLEIPKDHYIVWVETINNGTKNLGRLAPKTGLFSKTPKGSLETVTPFIPLRFFVTAEEKPDLQYPGTNIVLNSENYIKTR